MDWDKLNKLDLLFFWFFGEIDECDSLSDLSLLRDTYEKNLQSILSRNEIVFKMIHRYRCFTMPWHKAKMTEMLFKVGMI